MLRTTMTIHIAAEPEVVFQHLVDPAYASRGMTMEVVHETPEGVGSVYAWTDRMFGVRFKGIVVYTGYVPSEHVAFRTFGGVEMANTLTIEPVAGGSRLTAVVNARMRIPLLGRLLEPLLKRQLDKSVRAVKAEAEAARPRVPAAA